MAETKNRDAFLAEVAREIIASSDHVLEDLTLIVPGNRAAVYLRKHLSVEKGQTFMLPRILSFTQFLENLSGQKTADTDSLFFEFFILYQSQGGSDHFDQFQHWGQSVLSDFNEIDNYLLSPKSFFRDLRNLTELDAWSLNDPELSEQQMNLVIFWQEIAKLYPLFQKRMSELRLYYSGAIKRNIAENLPKHAAALAENSCRFIGFNALSTSEEQIIFGLEKAGKSKSYWDADLYYMDDNKQEAGHFLRRYQQKYGLPIGKEYLKHHQSVITQYETTLALGEVKFAGQLLADKSEFSSTCVVLADENLLLPFLYSLPPNIDKVNVTMGFSLRNAPLWSLIQALFELHINAAARKQFGIYHKDFFKVLLHPDMQRLLNQSQARSAAEIQQYVLQQKKSLLNEHFLSELTQRHKGFAALEYLFVAQEPLVLLSALQKLFALMDEIEQPDWQREIIFQFDSLASKLQRYIQCYPFINSYRAVQGLFRQMANKGKIDFVGEPLEGLQVMGMLETRALDFEHLIIVGANEGQLPASSPDHSLIPYELKMHYGLPTRKHKDAMYAYYFYRLLQRSKRADLIYCMESGDLGDLEKSRYLTQIEQELSQYNAGIQIQKRAVYTPASDNKLYRTVEIEKDDFVFARLDELLERGLSPSAINTYSQCPLNFYYRYILGLREKEEMEELMEMSTFGSIVHEVLENFMTPLIGKALTLSDISNFRKNIEKELDLTIAQKYSADMVKSGPNFLIRSVAKAYIDRFLNMEKARLEKGGGKGESIQIVALETTLERPLDLSDYGAPYTLNIKGNADRIEMRNGRIHIIDYKTGNVEEKDVLFKGEKEEMPSDKSTQLLLYMLMYQHVSGMDLSEIDASILSLRKLKQGFLTLRNGKKQNITEEDMDQFLKQLAGVINDWYNPNLPFTHTPDAKFCTYCGT